MGELNAFLKIGRQASSSRPARERIEDQGEVFLLRPDSQSEEQASRCMDCGTPFCHWACPMGSCIPETNDMVYRKRWKAAFELLDAASIMPEITGRVCPAMCEYACVLGISDEPITIRDNELAIIEYAFKKGFIKPNPPGKRTGKRVAVVGSGPAGLSAAAWLNRLGHYAVVFERDEKIGGILRYGIPDFKLEKRIIDRRLDIWEKEGVEFRTNANVENGIKLAKLKKEFDVICLALGSRVPRDLKVEGRNLKGIYFAMDYLVQSNRRVSGDKIQNDDMMNAKGKKVVVIGGGDTGADCVGVAHRQNASSIIQIEILSEPPALRTAEYPWPRYPMILKTSSSHEEGGERLWQAATKKFLGEKGHVRKISCIAMGTPHFFLEKKSGASPYERKFELEADLVIIAVGFLHPEHDGILQTLGLKLDKCGNAKTDSNYMTSEKGIFSAGDMRKGQSLVVWAMEDGKNAAFGIDRYMRDKNSP